MEDEGVFYHLKTFFPNHGHPLLPQKQKKGNVLRSMEQSDKIVEQSREIERLKDETHILSEVFKKKHLSFFFYYPKKLLDLELCLFLFLQGESSQ